MRDLAVWSITGFLMMSLVHSLWAAERPLMEPRVPANKLDEARALSSPLPDTSETAAKGKEIYEGKGTCFNCHGLTGRGDGPGGAQLSPSPRNFRHPGMWHHRTEGEIFWAIKHGIPGTGMIPFAGLLTDEEIWTVMQYERRFAGRHGPRRRGECCRGMEKMDQEGSSANPKSHHRRGPGRHRGMGMEPCCGSLGEEP